MRVVRLHNGQGFFVAVVTEPGRKFTSYVAITGYPLRKKRVKNSEVSRYSSDMDIPLKKVCRQMLQVGRQYGITKGARELLRTGTA